MHGAGSSFHPTGRWRLLERCRLLAERLLADLASDNGYEQLLTYCAAHPATYLGVVLATALPSRTPLDLTQRLPATEVVDAVDHSGHRNRLRTVTTQVRVERGGVRLNMTHKTEPAAAATTQLRLIAALCTSAGIPLSVAVICISVDDSVRLLLAWEKCGDALGFTVADLHLQGGAVLAECLRANGNRPLRHALAGVASLLLTPSPRMAENAHVKGLDTLRHLRELTAVDVPVQSLGNVSRLSLLQRVSLDAADIGDADVGALALLTALEEITLKECPRITSLQPLASLPRLTSVTAEYCEQLLRVAAVAGAPRLHRLTLCWNPFLKEKEVAQLLEAVEHVEDLALVGQYLPSTPPPGAARHGLCRGLRRLNLSQATVRGVAAWVARMPQIQHLQLSASTVTEADLNEMFPRAAADREEGPQDPVTSQVEVLSLVNCRLLHSSLAFATRLPSLAKLSISSTSLACENCADQLRQRGVDVDIL